MRDVLLYRCSSFSFVGFESYIHVHFSIIFCCCYSYSVLFIYQWGVIRRMGTTHRRGRKISFVLRLWFRFSFVYWLEFFVLRCLLLYVLEFVYIATLGR
jgi:hypothetical protein